jgi:hypothetical protein
VLIIELVRQKLSFFIGPFLLSVGIHGQTLSNEAYLKSFNPRCDGECGTPGPALHDYFGTAVALSANTLVVGAPFEDATHLTGLPLQAAGAAYVFEFDGTNWLPRAHLQPSTLDSAFEFGDTLDISGNIIAIGAPRASETAGRVTIFQRADGNWNEQTILAGTNAKPGDRFGESVALDGQTVVIGALEPRGEVGGAAYVFVQNGGDWTLQERLVPESSTRWNIGVAVAIHRETIVVGGTDEEGELVYVFVRQNGNWSEQTRLRSVAPLEIDGFGSALAIHNDVIVVGAYVEDSINPNDPLNNSARSAGAAFVFSRVGGFWIQKAYLKSPKPIAGDQFGIAVGVYDGRIIVGADNDSRNASATETSPPLESAQASGAAYLFRKQNDDWIFEKFLKPVNSDAWDYFGQSVAIEGARIIVGSPWEDGGGIGNEGQPADNTIGEAGAAYVFKIEPELLITSVTRTDLSLTIRFEFSSGLSGWQVLSVVNLADPMEDKTPLFTVTEFEPGRYRAISSVNNFPANTSFFRIAR